MSSKNLPLIWPNKKNSPELEAFLKQYGTEFCMSAEEINQLRDSVNEMAVIQQSTFMGTAEPSSTPSGVGNRYWIAVLPGTYANFGGVVVAANSLAIISVTANGVYNVSQATLNLTSYQKIVDGNKINPWTAKAYNSGDQVNYLGKDWVSNAPTVSGDVPGTSSKWLVRLTAYENKADLLVGKNLFNQSAITADYFADNEGNLYVNTAYNLSDYIPVNPSTQYISNSNLRYVTYYNINKGIIASTTQNVSTFITPIGAAFVRLSLSKSTTILNTFQLELGSVSTGYEAYKKTVNPEQLNLSEYTKTTEIPALVTPLISNKADLSVGKNKYNYLGGDTTIGSFLTNTNSLQVNSGYSFTGYIPITPGLAYYSNKFAYNGGAFYHFYDANKVFISSSNALGTVAPVGAAYLRYSLNINTGFDTVQIEVGSAATVYEAYKKTVNPEQLNLSEYTKTVNLGTALPDASVSPSKTTFFSPGINLFNKNDTGIILGQYLVDAFSYASHASYNTTPYIAINKTGTLYSSANGYLSTLRFLYFYDVNKALISSTINLSANTIPANAKFFRATYNVSYVNFQIEIGTVFSGKYSDYLLAIDIEKLPQTIKKDSVEVYLPGEICVGLGRTIELYHNQISICGNINNFTFIWTATTGGATPKTIGKTYKEKFSVNTSTKDVNYVGTYTLSLSVLDNDGNSVASASSVLKVVNKTTDIATPLRYLVVGDSLTNKPWLPETRLLANTIFGKNVLQWVGSIPFGAQFNYPNPELCKNEGRPGWRQDQYIGPGWGGAIKLYVSGVSVAPASKKQYYLNTVSNGQVIYEVEEVFNASGQLYSAFGGVVTTITFNAVTSGNVVVTGVTSGGTATGVSGAVAGDATLTYSKYDNMDGNPFWNPATSAVDFAYYFTNKGIAEPDAFVTMLGTNAITDTASLITFVSLIQTQMPNKKVFVLLPQFPGDYLLNPSKKKQFFDFAKNITTAFASNAKVFIVPVAFTHDSAHNFGWLAEDINPRNSNYKNYMPLDTVHPQECGYFQFADSMFSTFLAHYNS
ncbi:MAG: hypothetical protein B7Y83_00160 [Flavobacteriales bacterium 32-34-25]|nr:MAG: hypothetical protein B7Y83_00160 [Flavobacteriales bacterium 32-34-25]